MENDLISSKAAAVVAELSKDKQFAAAPGDRPFLDLIIQLLQQFMPLLIGCFATPKAVQAELQRPGLFTRLRLRSMIRHNNIADQDASVGAIANAVLKVGRSTTENEFTELMS